MTSPIPANIRQLRRQELDTVIGWAADEGWNPGLADAAAFWATDPEGFYAIDVDGELIGSASVVVYDEDHAFAGFFIVRPQWRGRSVGGGAAEQLLGLASERLGPNATVGIDGVFAMQPYYLTLGFTFLHRNLRMAGIGRAIPAAEAEGAAGLVPASSLAFEDVVDFDAAHFGSHRPAFLRKWLDPAGGIAVAAVDHGEIRGLGVVRPCREGYKIGPLFAASPDLAETIFARLSGHAIDEPLFLDIPECNPAAVALARQHELSESFGCARMYRGPVPSLPWQHIFGVTTFELG